MKKTNNYFFKIENTITYSIEITNYYFGRVHHKTTVTQDSIICEKFIAVSKQNHSITKRALTDEEKINLENFLSNFPLSEFKNTYYNKDVKDGTKINFDIEINNEKKEIYVSNYYIKELGNLIAEIIKLIDDNYIYYNNYNVKTIIEK